MTFKDLTELRSMDEKALQKELTEARHHYNVISFENSQGNLKDTSQMNKTRNYCANIKTVINERTPKATPAA